MIDAYFGDLLQLLLISPAVSSFKVLRRESSEDDGYIRVKCHLQNGDMSEFSEYVQAHTDEIQIITYSYHWQTSNRGLIKRWDNVPHHKEIHSFPHHMHLPNGDAHASAPMNLENIIIAIEKKMGINDRAG